MNSFARFFKIALPLALVGVLVIFSIFSLAAVNKLYTEENSNLEDSIISFVKQSLQEPLSYGDHVEVSRRLKAIIGQSSIIDICTTTNSFSFARCASFLNLEDYHVAIMNSPGLRETFVFYIKFRHKPFFDKIFWIIVPLLFFCLLIFSFGYFIMKKYEQALLDDFKTLTSSLITRKMTNTFFSSEFKDIKDNFILALADLNRINTTELRFSLSQKLAHDIRSPLSTLNLISNKIENNEIRDLHISVINQIKNIADSLLSSSKENFEAQQGIDIIANFSFKDLIEQVKKEFSIKNINLQKKINFTISPDIREISVHAPPFLYANLNNLIQNAIEATEHTTDATIEIKADLVENNTKIEIKIIDNGKGIPEEILSELGKKKLSYGKENTSSGHGIGVFNAYQEVIGMNGFINFESVLNTKTVVTIRLPISTF